MAKLLISIFMLCIVLFTLVLLGETKEFSKGSSESESRLEGNNIDAMYGASEGSLRPQECGGKCIARCSATAHKKPCMFFCRKCCTKCLCVPPGTYGNRETCPCYNNWKTKRGGPKCP